MTCIIGFLGRKGVGKNFVADITANLLSGKSVEMGAFADPIKDYCANVLGVDRALLYGNDNDKNTPTKYRWDDMPGWIQEKMGRKSGPMTVRHVMQVFGTELNREIWSRSIWTDAMKRTIDRKNPDYFLVTDVRYQNEVDAVQSWGGKVWKITGPQRGGDDAKKDVHSSETEVDSTVHHDIVIHNGLEDDPGSLRLKVQGAIKDCFGKI